MKTVRELIQALLLNCELDDEVSVEFKIVDVKTNECSYQSRTPKHVYHMSDGEALIECHDD